MKKQRRKEIQRVIDAITPLRDDIETLKGQEEDYYDNMPENMQLGEKGDKVQDAINNFEQALDSADNVIASLETVLEES
jgi:flagellar biosynthesis chaperone FliJ